MSDPSITWSDEELVEGCRRGEERAWSALVDKYKNLVYSVPLKYGMPPEDAADVFQSVWMELHAELFNLRQPGALRGWLVTVAGRKSYQLKRRNSSVTDLADFDQVDPALRFPEWKQQMERAQMLQDALNMLPERCQRMLRMLFFSEPPVPYGVVADELNLAEGSIGFIRGRCLKRLRRELERAGFEG